MSVQTNRECDVGVVDHDVDRVLFSTDVHTTYLFTFPLTYLLTYGNNIVTNVT